MIGRDEQEIMNDRLTHGLFHGQKKPKTRGETTTFLRLSAKMVDLSLHHTQQDSLLVDIPAHVPAKSECYPPEATVQLVQASLATIVQKEAKKPTQVEHSGFVQASLNLLRSDYRVRIHASPKWFSSLAILALTLIAFSAVYGLLRYHQDSLKNHSQIPTAIQQREKPVAPSTSLASDKTHNHGNTLARSKSKSRRRRDDYIAKDTYVYYGKDGKASH
jgi:hypothetical protein